MEKIDPRAVFPSEKPERVDFEIAFTALIVTIVLSTTGQGGNYGLLKGLAVSLSGLTLFRKMAVSNSHKDPDQVLQWSLPFIQAITIVAAVHVFLQIGSIVASQTPSFITPLLVASALVPAFVFGILVLHEVLFADANLYLAILSHNGAVRAHRADAGIFKGLDDWLLDYAGDFVSYSKSKDMPAELGWLEHRTPSEVSPKRLRYVFAIGGTGYLLIWGIVGLLFGQLSLSIIFSILLFFVKYPIQFWYSRFGLARFTTDRSGYIDVVIILISLVVANLTIIPEYTNTPLIDYLASLHLFS